MATATSHNKKSSAVKRILSEARELSEDQSDLYAASPLEDNIFEWHFTLRGPSNTEFANGLYHGRILLPAEYPMRPPNLMLLTPNGRWELNKKICLTFTGFHEEMWQPAWGIRTALLGLQTFMTAKAEAAVGIGALDYPVQAREKLAVESRKWKCDVCEKTTLEMLPDPIDGQQGEKRREEETLPAGLQVDLSAKSHKSAQQHNGSAETAVEAATATVASLAGASDAVPTPVQAETSAIPNPSSSGNVPIPPLPAVVAAPVASSQPQAPSLRSRPISQTSAPPSNASPSAPPTQPTTASTSTSRVTATEQKLVLIDNCIKALGVLVALLVFKRLI